MGVISDFFNEVTGRTDLREAKEKYEVEFKKLENKVSLWNNKIIEYNKLNEDINKEKQLCLDSIEQFRLIDVKNKNVILYENKSVLKIEDYAFGKVEDIQENSIIGSLAIGSIASCGVYTLASIFGTASTGTAIATLSGAAATNATFAAIGGGSLAAGGLGIAGGHLVLGTIFLAPFAFFMISNFNKTDQIKEKISEMKNANEKITKDFISLEKEIIKVRDFFNIIALNRTIYCEDMNKMVEKANSVTKAFVDSLNYYTKICNSTDLDIKKKTNMSFDINLQAENVLGGSLKDFIYNNLVNTLNNDK